MDSDDDDFSVDMTQKPQDKGQYVFGFLDSIHAVYNIFSFSLIAQCGIYRSPSELRKSLAQVVKWHWARNREAVVDLFRKTTAENASRSKIGEHIRSIQRVDSPSGMFELCMLSVMFEIPVYIEFVRFCQPEMKNGKMVALVRVLVTGIAHKMAIVTPVTGFCLLNPINCPNESKYNAS